MESETRSRLGGKDDDIDVDHYFLPGGILDTHHEEDMIGGSLLDEIGGAGNVKAVRSRSSSLLSCVVYTSRSVIAQQQCISHRSLRPPPRASHSLIICISGAATCEADGREQGGGVGPTYGSFNSG